MEFNDNKPIYKQIVDYAFNCIISDQWASGKRIPSVRELSSTLGVNSRTVLKAMEELQDLGVIETQRGMGFMLLEDAASKVAEARKREFFEVTLPSIREEMERLDISAHEVIQYLQISR